MTPTSNETATGIGSRFAVNNVKHFAGRDGNAFSASVYLDGRRVCTAVDEGCGGCIFFQNATDRALDELNRVALGVLRENSGWWDSYLDDEKQNANLNDGPLSMLVGQLVDEWIERAQFKRLCRGKVLFQVAGDDPEEWRVIKSGFNEEVRRFVVAKYGDSVVFANEKYLGQVAR